MAGKIIADTLEHSTAGSLDTSYVVNGSLKASFSVNQTANTTPLSSHNIASLVDTATGQTTYNLTNAFSSANEHSAVLNGNDASTWYYYTLFNFTSSAATTAVGTSAHDVDRLSVLANGDLA
tara:strand:+ start:2033 stop:2398 length:366 start_codon:yes stop_codon:yes gene_type:complete